jgi:dihydroorotase
MSDHKKAKTATAASGTRLTIRLPDDFHHHCRDGPKTACVLEHATKRFGRCLMMPNLNPPVTTTELAMKYKKHIQDSMPKGQSFPNFQPLMVLYLTDKTTPEEIVRASQHGIVGCKYYPAGATTNSDFGVTDIKNCYPALKEMDKLNMMLCIHSEVTHADIFEREPVFIEEVIKPLVVDFPNLKITMEHISTKQAVEYVLSAPDNIKASITCHHLLYNRNRKYLLQLVYCMT